MDFNSQPPNFYNDWVDTNNDKFREELKPLEEKLLSIGGEKIVPKEEIHLTELLNDGSVINNKKCKKIEGGIPSQCHENSAIIYEENSNITAIGTGWALSDDRLWRQHSWAMQNDTIIETTIKRKIYYGILLSDKKADGFCKYVKF